MTQEKGERLAVLPFALRAAALALDSLLCYTGAGDYIG